MSDDLRGYVSFNSNDERQSALEELEEIEFQFEHEDYFLELSGDTDVGLHIKFVEPEDASEWRKKVNNLLSGRDDISEFDLSVAPKNTYSSAPNSFDEVSS